MPGSLSKTNPPPFRGRRAGGGTSVVLALATILALTTAASAAWQDQASSFDQGRLAALGEAKQKALAEAHAGSGGTGDASAIDAALGPASHAPSPAEISGSWRCRTIKLGGVTPYVVYSWFSCRIAMRGGGLFFEKRSGSTRTSGYLYPADGGMVYLGAAYVTGEPQHAYSGNGASAGAAATPDDQIGVLTAMSANHARIEMPYPVQESTYDVIELKR